MRSTKWTWQVAGVLVLALICSGVPAVAADANAVLFGDFKRAYTIVDRMGTRVLRDPFTNKPNVGFYTTKRVGGMLTDSNAVKVLTLSL